MNLVIVNRHHKNFDTMVSVYCGRGSALGNPHKISANCTRDQACDLYDQDLRKAVQGGPSPIIDQLIKIVRISREHGICNLVCSCAPARCHTQSIVDVLSELEAK